MNCKLEIEVITPLFIGNGEKYMPFEYIFDRGFFNPINIEQLIETKLREGNRIFYTRILDGLKDSNINLYTLCQENRIDYKKFVRYSLTSPRLGSYDEVHQYIKTGGKVFIPGTSIKGALRSTLTKHALSAGPDSRLQVFAESINKAYSKFTNERRLNDSFVKSLDDEADKKIFGDTYDSSFRFISISDSNLQDPDVLKVSEVKILNICNGSAKWFSRMDVNQDNPDRARSMFLEGIKEGSIFTCFLNLEEASRYVIEESKIKSPEIVMNFVSCINQEIKSYIRNEISFFKTYGQTEGIARFYNDLLKISENLKENEFLLQLGFGTGMLSKTVLQYLDDDMKSKVAKMSKHRYYGNIYPKTRRIIFENRQPKFVPGWIKGKLLTD